MSNFILEVEEGVNIEGEVADIIQGKNSDIFLKLELVHYTKEDGEVKAIRKPIDVDNMENVSEEIADVFREFANKLDSINYVVDSMKDEIDME